MHALTWYTSSERYEAESSDGIQETDGASEVGCYVANNRRQHSDDEDRHAKGCPASKVIYSSSNSSGTYNTTIHNAKQMQRHIYFIHRTLFSSVFQSSLVLLPSL